MANELLVDTIGIIGILCAAKNAGLINEIKSDIDKLRNMGYRISDKLYMETLKKVGEA